MKTHNPPQQNLPGKNSARTLLFALASIIGLFATLNVQAASQTWTNAPVDQNWTNINNWVGRAFPGAGNNANSADMVTFNAPLTVLTTNIIDNGDGTFTTNIALIGSAGAPITNDNARVVGSILFYWRPSKARRWSERVVFPRESAFQRQNEFKDLAVMSVI